jgi:DUF438 domain-containing protein
MAHGDEKKSAVPASDRVGELKSLIRDLHDGVSPETAKARFDAVVKEVSPQELGAMEEELIREGIPVEEIQRLCDLHVSVVRSGLGGQEEMEVPPGHPAHTYRAENEVITRIANRLGQLSGESVPAASQASDWASDLRAVLDEISGIDNHYLRKENELFPVLERHGVTGPSQVMWGVHDQIRGQLKRAREATAGQAREEAAAASAALARAVVEMVFKENKILLPLAMQTLSSEEWEEVRRGEDQLGYGFVEPVAPFPGTSAIEPTASPSPISPPGSGAGVQLPIVSAAPAAPLPNLGDDVYLELGTGRLSLEQVDMMLRHLPVEISFVDAEGYVRYYSETEERLFPRTPGAIGRHVENCHPPKSLHMVKEILRAFASGEREVAEFWIEMQERFIHIRYFAVRNPAKDYLGCLEVTQDVTGIRGLEGERRLLEWS